MTAEPEIRSERKTVSGSSPFTVTFTNVEAGNYFFGVYSYDADTVGLIQDTYYLNADGTKAAGVYTATTFAVGEGATVSRSITLQKLSARTISGTLQFTKPLAQDLRLRVMSNGGSNSSNYFNVSAGATSAPFSVMAVTRPEGFTNYISMTVYVETAADTYPSSCYIYYNSSTCSYSIPIPSTDESSEYTLRCYTNTNGSVRNTWLTESGLSKKEADAKQYVFGTDSGTHNFTLLALSPYVSGKVYIPEDVEGTFSLYLYGYSYGNSLYLNVDTSTAQRDGQGRYVPYALTYDVEEMNFTLYYQVNSDNTGMLLNPCYYSMSSFYVTEGGTLSTKAGDAGTFHYTGETLNIDLTLLCWNDWDDRFIFQSAHGLQGPEYGGDALEYTYTYTIPEGCTSVNFHIVYADCTVTINGSYFYNPSDRYVYCARSNGEQVKFVVRLTGNTKYYGFAVDAITLNGTPVPSVGGLYTDTGSDPAQVLEDVRAGETLNAVFACGTDEATIGAARKAVAAVYDASGRFLEARLVDATVRADGSLAARFSFTANEEIADIRVTLLDDKTLSPVLQMTRLGT